jgi:hypothetical protein
MWACLLFLALPGLALTSFKDPEGLPISLTVTIGGTVAAVTFSVWKLSPKGRHARRVPSACQNRAETTNTGR